MNPSGMIKGFYYFSDCGTANFWSSFDPGSVRADFEKARDDGFNTVLFAVPWAAFQPDVSKPELDQRSIGLLKGLLSESHRAGLSAALRIGFLWESDFREPRTFERFEAFSENAELRESWLHYCRGLWDAVRDEPALQFGFLSWEDVYWPRYRYAVDRVPADRFESYARQNGFYEYASRRVPRDLARHMQEGLASPLLHGLYLEFFDEWNREIFRLAKRQFPKLHYEYRPDKEHITREGNLFYHYFERAFEDTSLYLTYYNTYSVDEPPGLGNLKTWLAENRPHSGSLFISQFNFFDNTYRDDPDFDTYRTIVESNTLLGAAVPRFIEESAELLKRSTSGYAVWAYRDVINDHIFNSSFHQGPTGFELSGGASCPGTRIAFRPGGTLLHRTGYVRMTPSSTTIMLRLKGQCGTAGDIHVSYFGSEYRIRLDAGIFDLELRREPAPETKSEITVASESAVFNLEKISLYSLVISNELYDARGEARPACEAIRKLNALL